MMMAHSINLCCGIADYTTIGWNRTNGNLKSGDRVCVIVDTRPQSEKGGDQEGADVYFAVNGECRPVAFRGVKETLCFTLSFYGPDELRAVSIVRNPTKPELPIIM